MSTHQDPLQRAVVGIVAMVSAGLDSAFNTLIGIAVHSIFLLFSVMELVWLNAQKSYTKVFVLIITPV